LQQSSETYQSGESPGKQNYKHSGAEGIAEDKSKEYIDSYVSCMEEQVALHDLEYKQREQQEAVMLTENRRRKIAMWSTQASNISKEHLKYLKISKQEEIALKQMHTELHQFKGALN
jgi:hypothetical protein